eukprot:scaffold203_cov386-Prasinococcus_capsulatus_cf.AAC.33
MCRTYRKIPLRDRQYAAPATSKVDRLWVLQGPGLPRSVLAPRRGRQLGGSNGTRAHRLAGRRDKEVPAAPVSACRGRAEPLLDGARRRARRPFSAISLRMRVCVWPGRALNVSKKRGGACWRVGGQRWGLKVYTMITRYPCCQARCPGKPSTTT